jgi:hypothetical protein
MTVSETLKDVQFVVGPDGHPTAALIDITAWQQLIALLEEAEDQGLIRSYLLRRRAAQTPEALGLIPWEQAEAALDAREDADDAPVG